MPQFDGFEGTQLVINHNIHEIRKKLDKYMLKVKLDSDKIFSLGNIFNMLLFR